MHNGRATAVTADLQRTAEKCLSTRVSFSGSFDWLWSHAEQTDNRLSKVGWGALIALWWMHVTTPFYGIMIMILPLWIPWWFYTQQRRHRIRAARETMVLAMREPYTAPIDYTPETSE